MTSAIMLKFSGLPDQKMLEVRNLFTEARQVYRWNVNSGLVCLIRQNSPNLISQRANAKWCTSVSVLEKVPFGGSEECESTHYVVGAWSHSTVIPASSQQKNTPLKGLLSLQSNSAIIMTDHNSEKLELFTDDAKCIKGFFFESTNVSGSCWTVISWKCDLVLIQQKTSQHRM